MKLLSILLFHVLWSGSVFSQSNAVSDTKPFRIVGADYSDKPETVIEIKNMPKIRSQDSLSICLGFSAATIAQKKVCDTDKKTFNVNDRKDPNYCSKIPPGSEKEISPFSMVAWSKLVKKNTPNGEEVHNESIPIALGSGASALDNSHMPFSFISESCLPFDKIVNTLISKNINSYEAVNKLIKKIEDLYNEKKAKTEAGVVDCVTCAAGDSLVTQISNLGIVASGQEVSNALKKDSFSEFLYSVMYGNSIESGLCEETSFRPFPRPQFDEYPKKEKDVKQKDLLPKIINVLKTRNPVQIGGVCLQKDSNTGVCNGTHSFVISGHKEACAPSKGCRQLVKVHNSWGQEWQDTYNDGWVDAQSIIENINDKPAVGRGVLSWLM